MQLNQVKSNMTDGLLKTANNLSEVRAYTDQLVRVGDIKLIPDTTAPKGWLLCDGSSKAVASYGGLHTVIGYDFGGSGANFNVPNISAPVAGTAYIIKFSEYTP